MSSLPTTLPAGWQETRLLPTRNDIRERADEILAGVPDDKHFAIVAVPSLAGMKLAAMARGEVAGGEWTFTGYVKTEWGNWRRPDGGVELRFTR